MATGPLKRRSKVISQRYIKEIARKLDLAVNGNKLDKAVREICQAPTNPFVHFVTRATIVLLRHSIITLSRGSTKVQIEKENKRLAIGFCFDVLKKNGWTYSPVLETLSSDPRKPLSGNLTTSVLAGYIKKHWTKK
jgi:hypothetical protein